MTERGPGDGIKEIFMSEIRKVLVIGGGPGGYVAALRAAQLGADVTLVEKKKLGGTCLNVGCIPTKAILHPAGLLREMQEADKLGLSVSVNGVDWDRVQEYKNGIVEKLTGGVGALLKGAGVKVVYGTASFTAPKTLLIRSEGNEETVTADRIIIATGSEPAVPPIPGLRESRNVIDSTAALSLPQLPKTLLVLGGGVIGVEFACAMQALGVQVEILEALPRITPPLDGEIAGRLASQLKSQGVKVNVSHKVTAVEDTENGVRVKAEAKGEEKIFEAETLLCCVGRRPYTAELAPEAGGIQTERGKILVNEYLETAVPGVYAVGDCVGQIMLAHTASAQGETAAENACGDVPQAYDPAAVPSCVYSIPEAAGAGLTEEQVKEKEIPYHTGKFPLSGNGRALIADGGKGFVKVLVGDEGNRILGVHILGHAATELIAEAALAIGMKATAEDVFGTIHAHPTVSEAVREAFLASENRAIHTANRKKRP